MYKSGRSEGATVATDLKHGRSTATVPTANQAKRVIDEHLGVEVALMTWMVQE